MSKVPVGSSPEVQQSFREVWEALDPYLRTNINLSGRRFINAGDARSGADYVTQHQVADQFGFEAFYDELKERGLDGFPGRLSEPQEAIAAAYPDPPPTTHAIGQIYYDPVSEQLKIVTDAGIIVLTTGPALTAESGSGNVVRLDGTATFTGNRNINAQWTFQQNLILSAGLPQISMVDTDSGEDDFYIKVNVDTWWVAGGVGAVSIFGCTTSKFSVWTEMECTGYFSTSSSINGYIADFTTSGLGGIVRVRTTATDGYAGFRMANDAREWSVQVRTNDEFSIQDITSGSLVRFGIDTAGAVKITPGPLTIEGTQPRLTFTDTTASAHAAYLQMDSDIFQINVDGDSVLTCGKTYTSLQQEATIAGSGKKLAFFGGTRQLKNTVAGSRSSNAALTALLITLHDYGLITDATD